MILNDKQIVDRIRIEKPTKDLKPHKVKISKGLSSFGYDLTLAGDVEELCSGEIDPKNFGSNVFKRKLLCINNEKLIPDYVIIPPGGFVLGHSLEFLYIPENVIAVCVGKSTYARCGLIVNVTPLEPGWRGQVTLEIHNTSRCSVRLYVYEGICQVLFYEGERPATTYEDKKGKYQDQRGIVYPKGQE